MNKEELKLAIKATLHYINSYGECYLEQIADNVVEYELDKSKREECKRNDLFTKDDIVKLVKEYFTNAVFDETYFLKYIDDIVKQRDFADEQ